MFSCSQCYVSLVIHFALPMSSDARASKLQKLDQFRKSLPYVSKSALSAILNEVDRTGVPELHARKQMKEATVTSLNQMNAYSLLSQL